MKLFRTTLLVSCSFFALTSCLKSDRISTAYDYVATVVQNEDNQVVLELDGGQNFYTSEKVNEKADSLKVGERLFLRYLYVNYDEQDKTATGSVDYPYEFEELFYEPMKTYEVTTEEAPEGDMLTKFYAPYLKETVNGDLFLNLIFTMPFEEAQEYYLVEKNISNDTIYYDFVVDFVDQTLEKETTHIETFKLDKLEEGQVLNINFDAKNYDTYSSKFYNSRTCILNY